MSKLSRRSLLGGLTSLGTPPSLRASIGLLERPDTDLLAICSDYQKWADELGRLVDLPVGSDPGDRMLWHVLDTMDLIEPTLVGTPACTLDGLRAKAAIVSWSRDGVLEDDPDGTLAERLVSSLLRDLLRPKV